MRGNPFKLDFCVLKVVLQYRHIRFALSRACISTADEDSGVFPLTGELYCACRWHLYLYRRWSPKWKRYQQGWRWVTGGSSACLQLGTTLSIWCMTPLHLKQRASAGCSVFCSDVMMPFCCKDTLLFGVLCKLEDGIRVVMWCLINI